MWSLKSFSEFQAGVIINEGLEIQVFQHQKFLPYGCDELLQILVRHQKAGPVHAIIVLECEHYSLFIFLAEAMIPVNIINHSQRGGECSNMSATGMPSVQWRQRPRWNTDLNMRYRHLRQTCTSLYHQYSWSHFPPCKIRRSLALSSSRRTGRW